jgi:hypothetical protein
MPMSNGRSIIWAVAATVVLIAASLAYYDLALPEQALIRSPPPRAPGAERAESQREVLAPGPRSPHSMGRNPSPQSRMMLGRSKTLREVFSPRVHPPGYPAILWMARAVHLPLSSVNFLFLLLAVLALGSVAHSIGGLALALPLVCFYLVCGFNYVHLRQYTSEAALIPLSLLVLLTLYRYLKAPRVGTLLLLSIACAGAYLCRYLALPWLGTVVAAHVCLARHRSWRQKCKHTVTWGIVSIAPIAAVMVNNYRSKGYITGTNRLGYGQRRFNALLVHVFEEQSDLGHNLWLILKTYAIDFASPRRFAHFRVNWRHYEPTTGEWLLYAAAIVCIGYLISAWYRSQSGPRFRGRLSGLPERCAKPSIAALVAEFWLTYLVVTIVFWTIGNMDPIHSRYLYPSYAFAILLAASGYERFLRNGDHAWARWLFLITVSGLVISNAIRLNWFLGWV